MQGSCGSLIVWGKVRQTVIIHSAISADCSRILHILGPVQCEACPVHSLSLLVYLLYNQVVPDVRDIDMYSKLPLEFIGIKANQAAILVLVVIIDRVFDLGMIYGAIAFLFQIPVIIFNTAREILHGDLKRASGSQLKFVFSSISLHRFQNIILHGGAVVNRPALSGASGHWRPIILICVRL